MLDGARILANPRGCFAAPVRAHSLIRPLMLPRRRSPTVEDRLLPAVAGGSGCIRLARGSASRAFHGNAVYSAR